jgi:hypothetical protein
LSTVLARPDRIRIGILTLETRKERRTSNPDMSGIKFPEIDSFLPEVGHVDVTVFRLQHQLDRLSRGGVVLNQQRAHANPFIPQPGQVGECMSSRFGLGVATN